MAAGPLARRTSRGGPDRTRRACIAATLCGIGFSNGSSRQPCRRDHCCRRRHAKTRPPFKPMGRLVSKRRPPPCSMRRDRSRAWHALNAVPLPKPTRSKIDAQRRKALRSHGHRDLAHRPTPRRRLNARRAELPGTANEEEGPQACSTRPPERSLSRPPAEPSARPGRRSTFMRPPSRPISPPFCSGRSPVRNPEPPASIATEPPRLANDRWAECGRNGWKRDEEVTALLEANRGSS